MTSNKSSRALHMAHILHKHQPIHPWADILKYAWYFERFRNWLNNGIVTFSYWKKDGSIRQANGTLSMDLIPQDQQPKPTLTPKPKPNYAIFNYFDLDRNAWRSFSITHFIGFVTIHDLKEKRTKRENHSGSTLIS